MIEYGPSTYLYSSYTWLWVRVLQHRPQVWLGYLPCCNFGHMFIYFCMHQASLYPYMNVNFTISTFLFTFPAFFSHRPFTVSQKLTFFSQRQCMLIHFHWLPFSKWLLVTPCQCAVASRKTILLSCCHPFGSRKAIGHFSSSKWNTYSY